MGSNPSAILPRAKTPIFTCIWRGEQSGAPSMFPSSLLLVRDPSAELPPSFRAYICAMGTLTDWSAAPAMLWAKAVTKLCK